MNFSIKKMLSVKLLNEQYNVLKTHLFILNAIASSWWCCICVVLRLCHTSLIERASALFLFGVMWSRSVCAKSSSSTVLASLLWDAATMATVSSISLQQSRVLQCHFISVYGSWVSFWPQFSGSVWAKSIRGLWGLTVSTWCCLVLLLCQ